MIIFTSTLHPKSWEDYLDFCCFAVCCFEKGRRLNDLSDLHISQVFSISCCFSQIYLFLDMTKNEQKMWPSSFLLSPWVLIYVVTCFHDDCQVCWDSWIRCINGTTNVSISWGTNVGWELVLFSPLIQCHNPESRAPILRDQWSEIANRLTGYISCSCTNSSLSFSL